MTKRIEVKNVSKKFSADFRHSETALGGILGALFSRNEHRELAVLDGVSFEVSAGEVLGVVGRNAAGKSTLLRLIAGVYQLDAGQIKTEGKIVYLTGVNQGSMPKLTMRENIYLMGAVMGLSPKEVRDRFDEIVEFSGLRDFVDMKVYQFSSGMIARLNFSTVVHCVRHQNPDILLLDEILSSGGDADFQVRATRKMEELLKSGAAVVLVSHNKDTLLKNCGKIIWLQDGKIKLSGSPEAVLTEYFKSVGK